MKRVIGFCTLAVLCGAAQADLMNISTSGVHSASLRSTACSIVGTDGVTFRGTKVLYIFGESVGNGRNPTLTAESLKYNYKIQNDNWRSTIYVNGEAKPAPDPVLYTGVLRAPKQLNDAAVVYFADPGEPLCAYTTEVTADGGQYQVALSITDVTSILYAAGIRSSSASNPQEAALEVIDLLQRQQFENRSLK